jgi:hypothetical protein
MTINTKTITCTLIFSCLLAGCIQAGEVNYSTAAPTTSASATAVPTAPPVRPHRPALLPDPCYCGGFFEELPSPTALAIGTCEGYPMVDESVRDRWTGGCKPLFCIREADAR